MAKAKAKSKPKAKPKAKAKAKPKAKTVAKAKPKAIAKPKAKKSTGKRKSGLSQLNYTFSPELQEIVGMKSGTRPQVVKKLWDYIKSKKCQDTKNKRLIVPDAKLSEVLGKKPIDMLKIAGCLSKHLKKA